MPPPPELRKQRQNGSEWRRQTRMQRDRVLWGRVISSKGVYQAVLDLRIWKGSRAKTHVTSMQTICGEKNIFLKILFKIRPEEEGVIGGLLTSR